jgi:hypothetical protein
MTKFYLELSVQGVEMSPATFEDAFDVIADALFECDGIENADLSGEWGLYEQLFTFQAEPPQGGSSDSKCSAKPSKPRRVQKHAT